MELSKLKKESTYRCPQCSLELAGSESFKRHMENIHTTSVEVCLNCPLFFSNFGELFRHARQIHNTEIQKIDVINNYSYEIENSSNQTNNDDFYRNFKRSDLNIEPIEREICKERLAQISNMETFYSNQIMNDCKFKRVPCEKEFSQHDTSLSQLEIREHHHDGNHDGTSDMELSKEKKEINYCCPQCPLEFTRSESFKKHMKNVHTTSVVVCSNCPLFFSDLGKLFLHARQFHKKEIQNTDEIKKHRCKIENCSYQTNNGGLYRHHMRSHLNIKPFECEICKERFTQKSNMKTHYNRHKKNNYKFKCESCEKEFNSYDTYLSHLETREHYISTYKYIVNVEYHCMKCNLDFNNAEEIYEHAFQCQTEFSKFILCKLCNEKLPHDLLTIQEHSKYHKNEFFCPFCEGEVIFCDTTKFNFHLTKVHEMAVFRRPVCRYCEASFVNEKKRKQHIQEEHKDLINKHKSREGLGRIPCSFPGCTFTTNSEIYFQKHLTLHYGKVNLDMFYKGNLDPNDREIKTENVENSFHKTEIRKRGRPRLCDTVINSNNNSPRLNDNSAENFEPKRKRGRPRKSESSLETPPTEYKKRGRPRKGGDIFNIDGIKTEFQIESINEEAAVAETNYTIDGIDEDPNDYFNLDTFSNYM